MSQSDISTLVSIFEGITTKLAESNEPNRLYDAAVQIAMETTHAQACSLYLEQSVIDSAKGPDQIIMAAGAGFEKFRIGVAKYKKGQGLTGGIWETSKSVKFDSQKEIEDQTKGWKGLYNDVVRDKVSNWVSYSLIGVPLRIGDRTIGVLKVENKEPDMPSYFTYDDQVMLEIIASTIALAIENQRNSEQSYSLILGALRDVSEMLVSTEILTFQMLCDRIVEKCIEVFNAEACSLYIQDVRTTPKKESDYIVMVSGAGYESVRRGAKYKKGVGLTGNIWEKSMPVKYDTRQEVEDPSHGWQGVYNNQVREKMTGWECSSLIGVPLRIGTRTIGVLKVENKKPVKVSHISHNELRGLEVLASNIALALEMRRQQQVFFKKGERARLFTHGLSNNVQNAQYAVREAIKVIAHGGGSSSITMKYLTIAEKTLDQIDRLRSRVLEETRVEQGKTTVSINQIMREVVERCKVLEREGIHLSTEFLEKDVFTSVDLEEVLQGFDMLIENSIDALKEVESPTVWIKAFSEVISEKTINVATLIFVDNGSGFTGQQISEFEDKGEIASTKHAGLGMGVSVAIRCFADNGVYLRIVEPPQDLTTHGAAFKIDFPLHEPRFLNVLIIDDDDSFTDMAKIKFRAVENVNVESQNTYDILQEAIGETYKGDLLANYDLILLDCYFEDAPLQGPELLKRVQDANSELASRIVLMSGKVEYQNRSDIFVLNKYNELERFPEGIHEIKRRQS